MKIYCYCCQEETLSTYDARIGGERCAKCGKLRPSPQPGGFGREVAQAQAAGHEVSVGVREPRR